MKKQVILFLNFFTSIQNGTNKDIKDSKITGFVFHPKFHRELIKQKYIKTRDTAFRGYPFIIDHEDAADYWGILLDTKEYN